jgi:hypothetical protein
MLGGAVVSGPAPAAIAGACYARPAASARVLPAGHLAGGPPVAVVRPTMWLPGADCRQARPRCSGKNGTGLPLWHAANGGARGAGTARGTETAEAAGHCRHRRHRARRYLALRAGRSRVLRRRDQSGGGSRAQRRRRRRCGGMGGAYRPNGFQSPDAGLGLRRCRGLESRRGRWRRRWEGRRRYDADSRPLGAVPISQRSQEHLQAALIGGAICHSRCQEGDSDARG